MEKMEAAVKRMASKTSAVAAFTLITALLPWVITFTPPVFRSLQVGFATDAWRLMVGWLTTPVLFLLVNFVILSIWATSSPGPGSNNNHNHHREMAEAVVAAVTADPSKRKETLIYLPPVVSTPVKANNLQGSVFSRSTVPENVLVQERLVPPPVTANAEEMEAEAEAEDEEDEEEAEGVAAVAPSREMFMASSAPNVELKISPPPRPSFMIEQQKVRSKGSSGGAVRRGRQMDRRNSAPAARTGSSRVRSLRTSLSEKKSSGGVVFGDSSDPHHPRRMESTDELNQRIESWIANFYAQLRLQRKESEDEF